MKRIFACISLLLMLALLPAHAQTPGRAAWVTVGGAPVYMDPHDNAQKAGHIWYGQLVTELERQENWCRIVSFTTTGIRIEGWVYAPNISMGAVPAYRRMAVVNNPDPQDRLHLRAKPSRNATSRSKYYNGTRVALDGDIRNGWVEVCVGMARGYMEAKYLTLDPQPGQVPLAAVQAVVNNSNGQLHLRPGPSTTTATSWGLFPNGTPVTVLGIGPDWCHVEMTAPPYMEGYMMTRYLRSADGTPMSKLVDRDIDAKQPLPIDVPGVQHTAIWPLAHGPNDYVVYNPRPQDRLHLRERPDTSAPSLGKYYTGVHVEVLSRQNGWAKVHIGNLNGYMMDEYLRPPDAGANPIGAMPIFEVQNPNRAQNLHLRQHPSLEARSLGLYNNNTRVIQMGFSGDWSHVITLRDGRMGFMLTRYLSPVR